MEFYEVDDVMEILGVAKSTAYSIMRAMNKELKEKGYFIIAGKVPKKYFVEKFYCDMSGNKKQKQLA
ncbi:ICEBs1 excisionase [uncultured Tissierella sp.]|uniref:ICEBs1 excisionase n=1 Tax=uncultured Tissierella sp. TaxID=448160 RepID=UPI002805AA9C|nr:ICEBs1 excisionase [uncultured Tissierella sp.]MDU5080283.1 transcriptional regulator [Bacillota bacterium]